MNTISVEVFVEKMMEVLKEFLESSTIHGLSYISTAKVRNLKYDNGMIFFIRCLTKW